MCSSHANGGAEIAPFPPTELDSCQACGLRGLLSTASLDPVHQLKNDAHLRLVDQIREDPETGCWVYNGDGAQHAQGYGWIRVGNVNRLAHRVAAWVWLEGLDDLDDMTVEVRRKPLCTRPNCVNPDHLWLFWRAFARVYPTKRREVSPKAA